MQSSLVDTVVVRFKSVSQIDEKKQKIIDQLSPSAGLEVRTWKELADLYRKVKVFYDSQNIILLLILIFIVVLGISNTIAMNILERVHELGTLQALGADQKFVGVLVILEALVMGIIGSVFGVVVALGIGELIHFLDLKMADIPGASLPQKIQFNFHGSAIAQVMGIIVFVSALASVIPLIYLLRKRITELLAQKM
ncbi:MAG: FtsX-like permease family protein [Bdellovibrionaceae bacterium]|nr:FtsX-like permease family protein [Pseudobdellovibrionaceae bacterium]MDW8190163.1 FtsX-like permease family protein [Pseudobdellovibrionaceae bacterium]